MNVQTSRQIGYEKINVTHDDTLVSFLYLSQTETLPVSFSGAIILFVTVSQSDSRSPLGNNFKICKHPMRSMSESSDIFYPHKISPPSVSFQETVRIETGITGRRFRESSHCSGTFVVFCCV